MGKLRAQTSTIVGRLILAGTIATGVIGGGIRSFDFDNEGTPIPSKTFIAEDQLNVNMSGSGHLVVNPLLSLSGATVGKTNAGSGVVARITYQNIANPAAAGFDICWNPNFTASATGSSFQCLLNDTCTQTGCTASVTFTGATLRNLWNGAYKIHAYSITNPTDSFDARVGIEYFDTLAE